MRSILTFLLKLGVGGLPLYSCHVGLCVVTSYRDLSLKLVRPKFENCISIPIVRLVRSPIPCLSLADNIQRSFRYVDGHKQNQF